jgi:hypothetical protein
MLEALGSILRTEKEGREGGREGERGRRREGGGEDEWVVIRSYPADSYVY